jgi:hypothetical protein
VASCVTNESTRTTAPAGHVVRRDDAGLGANESGSSALIRHSMAWPLQRTWSCVNGSGLPAAISIWRRTRSTPVTSSVTGCSTWMRVFISMK